MSPKLTFDPIDILARLDWTECEELEFKSARGGVPKNLWETYRAMASRYRLPAPSPAAPNVIDSVHKDDYSVHKAGHSVHKTDHSIHNQPGAAPIDGVATEDEIITQIAGPARANQRLSPKQMEQVILDLCRGRWLTRRQLSETLQRNPDGLRSRFLTPMVAHGLLRLRYPEKPNRTDQAYTTAAETDKESTTRLGSLD